MHPRSTEAGHHEESPWAWHLQELRRLRARFADDQRRALRDGAEPIEPHSSHEADAGTDEFDHAMALSRATAEQDALFEIDAALERIANGAYGVCEKTGRRIAAARLRAIPWTRYCTEAEAEIERAGQAPGSRLGELRSVHGLPVELPAADANAGPADGGEAEVVDEITASMKTESSAPRKA